MNMLSDPLVFGVLCIILAPFVIWFSLSVWRRPVFAMVSGLILAVFSLTHFGHSDLRYALAILLLPHFATAIWSFRNQPRGTLPSFMAPVAFVAVAYLSFIWSREPIQSVLSATAWVILLLFIFTFRWTVSTKQVRQTVFFVLLGFFFLSVLFLVSPEAWEAGRARGLFTNANTAGIFTFLLIGCSLWMGRKYWPWVIPAGLVYITATGSRAALLAAVLLLLVVPLARMGWRHRLVLGGLAVAVGYPALLWILDWVETFQVDEATSVLRSDNTRADRWSASLAFIQQNPWLGAGYGAAPPMVDHNSYGKLFAEFGLFIAIFGVILIASYFWWSRRDSVMLGITIGTLFNTFFEDWLLSAGAPMLIIYLLLVMSTPQRAENEQNTDDDHPTQASVSPTGHKLPVVADPPTTSRLQDASG